METTVGRERMGNMTGEQDVGENRTIEQETMDIYDKLPEGQKCLKEIGFSMEDGSGYAGRGETEEAVG